MRRLPFLGIASVGLSLLVAVGPAQAAKKKNTANSALMQAATGGKHIPEATIEMRRTSTGQSSGKRQYTPGRPTYGN